MTSSIVSIRGLSKIYASGLEALHESDLDIERGEIFALLGPNGAGKTTLISIVCGIVTASAGTVCVDGHDIIRDYRKTRSLIGLVPQELHTDMFETVFDTVSFSRGLFGLRPDPGHIETLLRQLALWDKRKHRIMTLSGGMKRRVLIAKALAHEPQVLFLDEPSAGVDVELRRDMWSLIEQLRQTGVTVVLTTHYIEEAERLSDRVGVIHKGRIIVVDQTRALMRRLGKKQLSVHLPQPIETVPEALAEWPLTLSDSGHTLEFVFDATDEQSCIPRLIRRIQDSGLEFSDLNTRQSSLEEIFVDLVREQS